MRGTVTTVTDPIPPLTLPAPELLLPLLLLAPVAVALTVPPAAVFLPPPTTPVPVGNAGNTAVVLTPTHSVSNLYSKLGKRTQSGR